MTTTTQPVTLTITGLPSECPHCGVQASQVTEWLLGMQGLVLSVICPRCFTSVAPVRAVAAEEK